MSNTLVPRLVVATHNQHKVIEFQSLFAANSLQAEFLAYDGPAPVEDGSSFAANALIKARTAAEYTGLPVLADDSGIVVELLGAAPGILSGRWAGASAGDVANRDLLLQQLSELPDSLRSARFVCALALVVPLAVGSSEDVVLGEWPGQLAHEASGSNGFGYDSIFIPDGFAVSVAELTPQVKDDHSHRARAVTLMLPILRRTIGVGQRIER